MPRKSRILLLNGTCLDVVDSHRKWLAGLDAEIVVDHAFRKLDSEKLFDLLKEADGIVVPAAVPMTPKQMQNAPRLRAISFAASGYDSLDVAAATRLGIVVTNAPVQEGAEVVADMTWGLLLAIARQIPLHDRQIRSGNLGRGMGTSPWRKTLGIIGLGNIGRAVARRAAGFEMQLLATDPRPEREFAEKNNIEFVPLEELLMRSDFVSLHVRLDEQNVRMIGRKEFEMMKPSAFIINTARHELIDEDAMIEALASDQLAGAALDDPPSSSDSRLLDLDNVVLTTHLGNRALVGVDAVFRNAVQNAVDVLRGHKPEHIVNPEVYQSPFRAIQDEHG